MPDASAPIIAIVDYGMGNLYSVKHACEAVGLACVITSEKAAVLSADAVIVPGVGAFGDAMQTLRKLDLVAPLRDLAASGRPLIGICLGLQLFMTESEEFGHHQGLGLIEGRVVRFPDPFKNAHLKVPHIGWNQIFAPAAKGLSPNFAANTPRRWAASPLQGITEGSSMYFVHSFYAKPADSAVVLSCSYYGEIEFCSSIAHKSIFACQYHPERSGTLGLRIYQNIAATIQNNNRESISHV